MNKYSIKEALTTTTTIDQVNTSNQQLDYRKLLYQIYRKFSNPNLASVNDYLASIKVSGVVRAEILKFVARDRNEEAQLVNYL